MEAIIVLVAFLLLVLIGVPIGWSIAGVSLLTLFYSDVAFSILPMKMVGGVNTFTLCAGGNHLLRAADLCRAGAAVPTAPVWLLNEEFQRGFA